MQSYVFKWEDYVLLTYYLIETVPQISFTGDRCNHGSGHTLPASPRASDARTLARHDCVGTELSLCR